MRRSAFLLLVALAASVCLPLLVPGCAFACSCASLAGSPQERAEGAYSGATAVFAGEVIDVDGPPLAPVMSSGDPVVVTFRASGVWKGPKRETLEVSTAMSGASCGYEFRTGEEYLVYASEGLQVSLCGETKPLSEADADLEALGAGGVLPDTSGASGFLYLTPRELATVGALATIAAVWVLARRFLRGPS